MIDNSKPLAKSSARSKAGSPLHGLLKAIIRLFVEEKPQDKPTQLQKWEREKAIKLGLAVNSSSQNCHKKKHVDFVPWNREKVSNFDLAPSHAHKKSHRKPHHKQPLAYPEISAEHSPPSNLSQPKAKISAPFAVAAGDEIDDFFKILGYE